MHDVLDVIVQVTDELAIDYVVVGATARDILLTHVFGIDTDRATRDVDFAIAVESWVQFDQLKAQLASQPYLSASDRLICRLEYSGPAGRSPIDLVPFGGVASPSAHIAWPPDMDVVMNVAGYQDVLITAERVQVTPALTVRVASLPGLAILKLLAWLDRGSENPKDAHDLLILLRRYMDAGNSDRLYDEALEMLESVGYDPERGGAYLLGLDACRVAGSETKPLLTAILNDPSRVQRLCVDMARSLPWQDEPLTYTHSLIAVFAAGLRANKA